MKTFIAILILSATSASAGTAFLSGERRGGMNKICYYNYLGSTIAITVSGVSLCPLTIKV